MKYINFEDTADTISDEFFMKEALKEAQKAFDADEIPIGAIVVHGGNIIARGHNLTETLNDVTAHAEMQALTAAANYIGGKYLKDCTLYVTVEPCVMCAGASYWAQVQRIVFGAKDDKRGYTSISENIIHPKTTIIKGVLDTACSSLMRKFFELKR
ncbi:nucleoside deaminase [Olivibacter sp. SDN3]|uniref:nucleoside deaminase n=1 Tax=Olivibacter sp. SDN3 TaxID=2764720 RepID=UPI0016510033|nr:nucleoside deaminase [Olivibacter sp. SDN3]QNL50813.1 nucleoside deaminase [Olivibacter sp. SDN3]